MQEDNFLKKCEKSGFSLKDGFTKIGFIFNDFTATQAAYTFITNTNHWLKENFGSSICAFYEENSYPCVPILFPRFGTSEISSFQGHIISTSFETTKTLLGANRAKKYYYIDDIEYIRPWFKDKSLFDKILNDNNIIKLFRAEDHYNKFVEDGYKIQKRIVVDYDINTILKVINENR